MDASDPRPSSRPAPDRARGPVLGLMGLLLLGGGMVAMYASAEAQLLWWFGKPAEGVVTDCYYQDGGGDTGGWTMVYAYTVATAPGGREFQGTAGTLRRVEPGACVPIVYLPWLPGVSDSKTEVRLGAVLGPLLVGPTGIVFVLLGGYLICQSLTRPGL